MSIIVRVDSKGRIMLPKDIREKLGINPGSHILVEVKGRERDLTQDYT